MAGPDDVIAVVPAPGQAADRDGRADPQLGIALGDAVEAHEAPRALVEGRLGNRLGLAIAGQRQVTEVLAAPLECARQSVGAAGPAAGPAVAQAAGLGADRAASDRIPARGGDAAYLLREIGDHPGTRQLAMQLET